MRITQHFEGSEQTGRYQASLVARSLVKVTLEEQVKGKVRDLGLHVFLNRGAILENGERFEHSEETLVRLQLVFTIFTNIHGLDYSYLEREKPENSELCFP